MTTSRERDETSPFLDYAGRGFVAGLAGALVANSAYFIRNHDYAVPWVQLGIEVTTFAVFVGAFVAGFYGALATRMRVFPATMIAFSLVGPPAVAFASWRFGSYPIPFVDAYVVGGGVFATLLSLGRAFSGASLLRVTLALVVAFVPVALVAIPAVPTVVSWVQDHQFYFSADDAIWYGALAGAVIGPFTGAALSFVRSAVGVNAESA